MQLEWPMNILIYLMKKNKMNKSPDMEFIWPIRVYIEDTDAGGIVYYVNYLKFMERSRTEYLRSLGFGKAGANNDGYYFVVRSADIDYIKPARLDDSLNISCRPLELKGASLLFTQEVTRGEELLASAVIKIACVSGPNLQPTRIPKALREVLAGG